MFSFSCSKVTSGFAIAVLASLLTPVTAVAEDAKATLKAGQAIYAQTCIACHGANGKGAIPGVSDFTANDGPLSKTDDELWTSIRDGLVTPGAALSMPAKGGNPALSDADIQAVLAYLRKTFGQ